MEKPNKPTSLSITDRRNIAKCVKSIKNSSQIIKLKRVTQGNSEKKKVKNSKILSPLPRYHLLGTTSRIITIKYLTIGSR